MDAGRFGLRMALYATRLGAVLTVLTAWMRARQDALAGAAAMAGFHAVLVPLLALLALGGALLLERTPAMGMLLLLLGSA
ncbi:MAG: hypothetical protein ACRD1E_08955, partial [Terriglobales bacterium]